MFNKTLIVSILFFNIVLSSESRGKTQDDFSSIFEIGPGIGYFMPRTDFLNSHSFSIGGLWKISPSYGIRFTILNTKLFYAARTGNRLRFGDVFFEDFKKSKNIKLFINATVSSLNVNQEGKFIESLSVFKNDINKNKVTVKSKVYILSCGAVENARILLLSDSVMKNGK